MVKIKKLNVVYHVDEKDLQPYLNDGFIKVEPKKPSKKEEVKEKDVKKEDKILPPKDKEVKEKDDAKK